MLMREAIKWAIKSKASTILLNEPSFKSSGVKSVQTQSSKSKHSDSRKQQQDVD
jgi:hypothetical protein